MGSAEPEDVRIEVIQPFKKWFLTESMDLFLRVSNFGDNPIPVRGRFENDIFFEVDPGARTLSGDTWNLPKVEGAREIVGRGLLIPSGMAYAMSDADYNAPWLGMPELFTKLRVHLLVEVGSWVSSPWVEREILPDPQLDAPSLYKYELDPNFSIHADIISLAVDEEVWLFSHYSSKPDRVGRRLCRIPDGLEIASISHDMESRRLTINFTGEEEPVLINTRSGFPVSGSERTVPHLHLWEKVAGRPYTDSFQLAVEAQQGRELDIEGMLLPVERDARHQIDSDSDLPSSARDPSAVPNPESKEKVTLGRQWLYVLAVLVATAGLLGWWRYKPGRK